MVSISDFESEGVGSSPTLPKRNMIDRKTVLRLRAMKKLRKRRKMYKNILAQYYALASRGSKKERLSLVRQRWYHFHYVRLMSNYERIKTKERLRYHPQYGYLCSKHLYLTKETENRN